MEREQEKKKMFNYISQCLQCLTESLPDKYVGFLTAGLSNHAVLLILRAHSSSYFASDLPCAA